MGYFLRTTPETQKRLTSVLNQRKEEEDARQSEVSPLGGTEDAFNINAPIGDQDAFADSMPGLRITGGRQDPRERATRETTSTGAPRLTDEEKDRGIKAGTAFESAATDPAVDMTQLKITDPIKHQEIVDGVRGAQWTPPDLYNVRTVIGQGNVAGADLDHINSGTYITPADKVPLDGKHPKMLVISPEDEQDAIYLNELEDSLTEDTVIRVEGESRFGTLNAKQSFAGMGKVILGFVDVAASPFEAFAETGFQLTHTLPWNTTMWEDGYNATIAKHRNRGLFAQIAVGVVFDPFVLGKGLKIAAGLSRSATRRFIQQAIDDIPEIPDADKARIAQQVEDTVIDPDTGLTFDFEREAWWSPRQYRWIPFEGGEAARAHLEEYGTSSGPVWRAVALTGTGRTIAGGSPEGRFPGGTGWGASFTGTDRISNANRLFAEENGISIMEVLRRRRGTSRENAAINRLDIERAIDQRDAEQASLLGGKDAADELESAVDQEFVSLIDQAAQVEGQAGLAGLPGQQWYRDPDQVATPFQTAEVGALVGPGWGSEAEFKSFIDQDYNTWGDRLFGNPPEPPKPPATERLRNGMIIVEETLFDKNARINKDSARVSATVLPIVNKYLRERGGAPLYKLPDAWNPQLHFSLGSGMESAADTAWHIGRDDVLRALGNNIEDINGSNVSTTAVDAMAALLHHVDVVAMTNVDLAGTQLRRLDVDEMIRLGKGESRAGPAGMSIYQMREAIQALRKQLGDTAEHTAKKAAHEANERAKWTDAAARGESYTQVPYTKAAFERVMDGVEALVGHYKGIREMYVESGIMSRELSDKLENIFPYYNPVKYVEGELRTHIDPFGSQRAMSIGMDASTWKELGQKGLNPEAPVFQRPMQAMASATREAYRNIYYNNMAVSLINKAYWDDSLPPGLVRKVVTLDPGQKLRNFEISSDIQRDTIKGYGIKTKRVSRRINGVHEVWEIPEVEANLLESMTQVDYNLAMRILRMANRPFRMMFTSHNPVFMAANFLHDMMVVMMNEGVMPKALVGSLYRNLTDIHGRDEVMSALKRYGGDVGGYTGRDSDEIARESSKRAARLESGMTEFSTYEQFAKWAGSPLHFLNYLSSAIEMAPRRATFKNVLDREQARRAAGEGDSYRAASEALENTPGTGGAAPVKIGDRMYDAESVRAAAYAARNVTVDFQKYGKAIKLFDSAFLYTNAAIQGTLLPVRALRRGGVRLGAAPGTPTLAKGQWARRAGENRAKIALLGFAGVATMVYAWNRMMYPEAFRNMSLQDRITRLQVIYGEEEQEDGTMQPKSLSAQPLLREYSSINAGIVMTLDKMFDLDSANVEQFLTALLPQMNPMGTVVSFGGRDSSFGVQKLPTITAPGQLINETFSNWDSFRNAPIVDKRMESLPESEQYDEYTSETAKRVGGFFNFSPMRVDHLMSVGAVRDLIMGMDQIIQIGDENKSPEDLALDSAAAELEAELELMSAPERPKKRNEFFTRTKLEYLNKDGVLVTTNITSAQRRKIELLIREKPTGVPVFSTLVNRFNRQSGGQLRRTGVVRASKEFGTDAGQTARMASELGMHLSHSYDAQLESDMRYRKGVISAKQWREAEQKSGIYYQAVLYQTMALYPKAAQSLRTEDGLRSPKQWQDYLTMIKTGVGAWDDTRTQGQMFAAAQRAVEMPMDFDGLPDYATYFMHIDEVRNAIDEAYPENGIELLDAELMSVMTDMQRQYYREVGMGAERGGLRTYWDIAKRIAARTPGMRGLVYRRYLNANDDGRKLLKDRYSEMISSVQREVNREREAFRQNNPTMDHLYVKWGYAEAGRTAYGDLALQRRLRRGSEFLSAQSSF